MTISITDVANEVQAARQARMTSSDTLQNMDDALQFAAITQT